MENRKYGHPDNRNIEKTKVEWVAEENSEPTLKERREMERFEGQHNYFRGNGFKSKNSYKNKRIKK